MHREANAADWNMPDASMALIRATTVSIRSHFNRVAMLYTAMTVEEGGSMKIHDFWTFGTSYLRRISYIDLDFCVSKTILNEYTTRKKRVEHLTYKQCPCCHGSLIFRLYGYSHPVVHPMKPISVQGHPQYWCATASNKIWWKPKVLNMFMDGSTWQH